MRNLFTIVILCFLSLAACDCAPAKFYPAQENNLTTQHVSQVSSREHRQTLVTHIKERTVLIKVDCAPKKGVVVLNTPNPDSYGDGWGTGVIIRSSDNKSYLFTAAHVVLMANKADEEHMDCQIDIQRSKNANTKKGFITANIITFSRSRDVAILSVNEDLGVSTDLELNGLLGDEVFAAGFPVQKASPTLQALSITKGVLATEHVTVRRVVTRNGDKYSIKNGEYYRVTSQVYFGNSGGGIWNEEGKLLAVVNNMYLSAGGAPFEGYYYVRPVKEVLRVLDRSGKFSEVFGD